MIIVREFELADLPVLAGIKLRTDDEREIEAGTGMAPNEALCQSCLLSEICRVAVSQETGNIVTIWGLRFHEEDPTVGHPWMVGTDEMLKHKRDILRLGKQETADFLNYRNVLINMMDTRNRTHRRWLTWIGYHFTGQTVEIRGVPFAYFILKGNLCVHPQQSRWH
jgi:hypothetical protein